MLIRDILRCTARVNDGCRASFSKKIASACRERSSVSTANSMQSESTAKVANTLNLSRNSNLPSLRAAQRFRSIQPARCRGMLRSPFFGSNRSPVLDPALSLCPRALFDNSLPSRWREVKHASPLPSSFESLCWFRRVAIMEVVFESNKNPEVHIDAERWSQIHCASMDFYKVQTDKPPTNATPALNTLRMPQNLSNHGSCR